MSDRETIRFPVAGMTCASCVNRITRSLRKVDGVSTVRVDLGGETATVTRVRDLAPDAALVAAIAAAGYAANLSAADVVPAPESRSFFARFMGSTR